MGKIVLVARLAGRDIRRHKAQAVLLLLAITAATTTLALGLALNGVTSHPYQQTRALTNGPDLVAGYGVRLGPGPRPAAVSAAQIQADTSTLTHLSGVTGYSGPFPVASAILRTHGLTVPVQAEGRGQTPAAVDQPKLTAGSWVRPGGVVIERTLAEALGVGVGDRVTLDGRPFTVTGIAVTAAAAPYPNCQDTDCLFTMNTASNLSTLNVGLTWVTEADARALVSPQAPLSYMLNLKLKDPATAPALANQVLFANGGVGAAINRGIDNINSWQGISSGAGQLVQDEQGVLRPGALLAVLLAVASVAVLAGGRMAERTRRVGLLKAVGSTPGLVAAVLMAENLVLALAAAAAGLVIGWAAAPLITNPGAGLIGTAGAPSITPATIGLTIAAAVAVALASTLVPAIKAAHSSTVSALADSPRPPRRRAALIALSARLPVPLLLGIRMAAGGCAAPCSARPASRSLPPGSSPYSPSALPSTTTSEPPPARSVTPWSAGTPRCCWSSRSCWSPWPCSTRSAPPGPRCWTSGVPRRWPVRSARPRRRSVPGWRGHRCCPRCRAPCWASRWASRCSRSPAPGR